MGFFPFTPPPLGISSGGTGASTGPGALANMGTDTFAYQAVNQATPFIAWTQPGWANNGALAMAQVAGTSASLYFIKIYLATAQTVTNINTIVTIVASATPTHAYAALVSPSGTVLASTADRRTDGALTSGAPSLWVAPLSAAYAAAAGEYFVALMCYTAGGQTNPSIGQSSCGASMQVGQASGAAAVQVLAGQTSIAGPYTMTSNAVTTGLPWVALS